MRILVGWDDSQEAKLISLYLDVDDHQVFLATTGEEVLALADREKPWDVILISTTLPDTQQAFELCLTLRELHPDCPLVGACRNADVYEMARFLTNGMQHYFIRDTNKDFLFLLHLTLLNVVKGVRAERERQIAKFLRQEVDSVRKLQESLIPPEIPCPKGYQIRARYESSQIQVLGGHPVILAGGDYYDVVRIDDDTTVIVVGDASGHGMRACMSIMIMQALARMIHDQRYRDPREFMQRINQRLFSQEAEPDPAWFVEEINRRLCKQSVLGETGGFITLLYGVLNTRRHEFHWTSAGHPLPILQDLGSGKIRAVGRQDLGGLPLGILDEETYQSQSCQLPPRSRLLIYSDGLIEAFPVEEGGHQEYGLSGVEQTLARHKDHSLNQVLKALFQDSHAFTGGHGRHDDTTVVLIERS
jgi:serine phosphatase RsbU (regulator of sigma subunit)